MRNAIDFSFARPTTRDVSNAGVDVLVYTGNAIPSAQYLRDMRASGICVCMIQESDPNRAQQGYGAGVTDSNYANGKANSVGYPPGASICFVVSDGSANDPNTGGDNIAQYAAGVQSNSSRPFFFYGNRYAVDNAMRGAPRGLGCWVPSTWGAKASDLLIQEANMQSPVADTDLNTVQHYYGAWGQTTTGDDDVTTPGQMAELAQWEQDTRKVIIDDLTVKMAKWDNDTRSIIIDDLTKKIAAIPSAGGGLTEDQVRTIVRDELNKTKLGT